MSYSLLQRIKGNRLYRNKHPLFPDFGAVCEDEKLLWGGGGVSFVKLENELVVGNLLREPLASPLRKSLMPLVCRLLSTNLHDHKKKQ